MSLNDQLVLYCERQGPELYAEPLNALSNLAFIFWAWKLWTQIDPRMPHLVLRLRLLAGLIALVGAGSLAFHTFATRWASILDIAFIGIFNLAYLVIFLRLVARWPEHWAFAAAAGFLMVDRVAASVIPGDVFNGSALYLPAVVVLLSLTAYARRLAPQAGRMMTGAAAVFAVSLLARSVDQALCPYWPWGTHVVWHLLNGWVLYQLSRALAAGARHPDTAPRRDFSADAL